MAHFGHQGSLLSLECSSINEVESAPYHWLLDGQLALLSSHVLLQSPALGATLSLSLLLYLSLPFRNPRQDKPRQARLGRARQDEAGQGRAR